MDVQKRNQILSLILGVVIIILGYMLYHAIVDPYEEVLEEEAMTERVRERMMNAREGLRAYDRRKGNFPPTDGGLDSLVNFLKEDSVMVADADSLFQVPEGTTWNPDSVIYSPRTGNQFEYALNDTLNPEIYELRDPDSDDKIGDLERTTLLNAANWQ